MKNPGLAAFGKGAFALAVLSNSACAKIDLGLDDRKPDPFEVQIRVASDPGQPLAGAELLSGSKVVGKTDAAGSAKVRFDGRDGEQLELSVRCPPDYESPISPLTIPLRRLAKGSEPPRFEARCAPSERTVVIALRVEKGPNLPVIYLGRTVARTDASGAALFTAKVKPGEQVEVMLSTAEKEAGELRPQNPTLTFVAKDYDDFVVLDENFTVEKKPTHYQAPKPAHRPTPLQTGE